MKAMIALMRQEIVERRLLAAAGLLLGLLPLGMPFLPHVSHQPATDLRGVAALILAGLLSGALALILGATVVGRDLGERRLGFFFARPLAGWTIWGGKMTAALLIAWGAGLLVLLPAVLLGDLVEAELWDQIGIGAAAVLVVVPLAHAAGVLLRARSAWLLLDLIGLAAFGVLAYDAITVLGRTAAVRVFQAAAWGLGAAAFAALVAAGLIQVARGRTDLRRGHRALSVSLWGGLLAAVLLLQGAVRWVVAAPFSSLEWIELAAAAPAGSWLTVSGPAAHRGGYRPAFLLDLSGRVSHRIPVPTYEGIWWDRPEYSADGRRVVWMERWVSGYQARVADLRDGEVGVRRTIPLVGEGAFHLSPTGDLLATLSPGRLLVEEAVSGRLLASVPVRSQGPFDALRFLSPARVRVAVVSQAADGLQVTVQDVEIAGSRSTTVWQLPGLDVSPINLAFSPDGALLHMRQARALRLWDIAAGKELAIVPVHGFGHAAFLPDGRWAAVTPFRNRLHLFSRRGEPLLEIPLPGTLALGALVAPDLLSVSRSTEGKGGRISEALLVDLRTGGVRSLGPGLRPVADPDAQPGSLGARTFVRGRELLLLDPATGKLQPVPLDEA